MSYTCCSTKFRSPVPPGSTGKAGEALWALWALWVAPAAAPQVTRRGGPEKWSEKWHDAQWCPMMFNDVQFQWCPMAHLKSFHVFPVLINKLSRKSTTAKAWNGVIHESKLVPRCPKWWALEINPSGVKLCNLMQLANQWVKKNDQNQLHMWQLMPPTLRCLMLQKSWRLWNPAAHQPSVEEWNHTWFSSWFSIPGAQFGGLQLVCTQLCQKNIYSKKKEAKVMWKKNNTEGSHQETQREKMTQTSPNTHTHTHTYTHTWPLQQPHWGLIGIAHSSSRSSCFKLLQVISFSS